MAFDHTTIQRNVPTSSECVIVVIVRTERTIVVTVKRKKGRINKGKRMRFVLVHFVCRLTGSRIDTVVGIIAFLSLELEVVECYSQTDICSTMRYPSYVNNHYYMNKRFMLTRIPLSDTNGGGAIY